METIEEEINLAKVFSTSGNYNTILVDCLTLWINNLLYAAEQQDTRLNEDIIAHKVEEILKIIHPLNNRIIFVTNEVGMGVVPEIVLRVYFETSPEDAPRLFRKMQIMLY